MERKEAIEVIKKNWPDSSFTMLREALETVIPELKESEDDIMRKMAIKAVYAPEAQSCIKSWGINPDDVIAWLEKQGEQKFQEEVVDNLHNYLYGEQKPAWSEEDEYQINTILHGLDLKRELYKREGNKVEEDRYNTQYNWLKSLKDRVQPQPKQEWSEEDERILNTVIHNLRYPGVNYYKKPIEEEVKWLKSLKDRHTWKPSDEQMDALNDVISSRDIKYDVLSEFWKDLKKLKQ